MTSPKTPSNPPVFCLGLTLLLALGIAWLDWLTKTQILVFFSGGLPPVEVTSFFNLVLVFNTGVSFGFLAESNPRLMLVALNSGICLGLMIWLWRSPRWPLVIAFGFIIGGALGNIYDRIMYGAVVDFLDFHIHTWHWPAFNLADTAITMGAIVFLIDTLTCAPVQSRDSTPP